MGCSKGQTMMEYLVTYGWALLLLLFVVALLVSSGAFSIGNFSSQECVFQPGLPCHSFILYHDSASGQTQLLFRISNNLGFPINITQVNYTVTNIGQEGRRQVSGNLPYPSFLFPGMSANFSQNFSGHLQPQPKESRTISVSISYLNCNANACRGPYQASGRISAAVERG
ncbi:MAG: hypothetical protein QXT25_01970 [Candidatus Anstonellaceae archaeon]